MAAVACELLGEPSSKSSKEIRFGSRGSVCIRLDTGLWHDHEAGCGGGVIDLVQHKTGCPRDEALKWLRDRGHLPRKNIGNSKKIFSTYDYCDESGALLFQVCRFQPKDFRQRAPDGNGGWRWKMDGIQRVIFRLPEVLAAIKAGQTIYICEGEKACEALVKLGCAATCSPGGANKFRQEYAAHFAGADCVVLPDNDAPGRQHAASVAKALHSIAARVRIVVLPGLPEKGDVADWIAAGGTAAQLVELGSAAETYSPDIKESTEAKPRPDPAGALILSSSAPLDSARKFLIRHHTTDGTRTLHHQNGTFYAWEGSHYVERPPEVMRAALYGFLDKAKTYASNGEIVDFEPNKSKVANVLEATAAEAQLAHMIRPPAWLDGSTSPAPAEIIACRNKLLHLPTMQTRPHTPQFFTLNALDFDFDLNAPEPKEWLGFLQTIWPNDPQAIETLQEIFGLCLTAETKYQKAFLIVGPKRSGKGTIARVLTQVLGAANVCGPTLSGLATNFGLQPLIGKRLAIISDARLGGKADAQVIVERLLAITGEDALTIDRKFRDAWTGRLDVRFLLLTNELPRLTDSSGALAGRLIILTMTRSFYGKEDLGLGARLTRELPGILPWAIAGWQRLTARGYFVPPKSSEDAMRDLADLGSPISAFLRDRCIVGPGYSVRVDELYSSWCRWCEDQGRDHPGTKATFGRDLSAAVPGLKVTQHEDEKTKVRHRYYNGVTMDVQGAAGAVHAETRVHSHCNPNYYNDDPGP